MRVHLLAAPLLLGTLAVLAWRQPVATMQEPFPTPSRHTFKVATWNIRSGMGIRGFLASQGDWSNSTLNCTDPTRPMNAWGLGMPQRELKRLAADQSIVAVALQEAWNCASPARVNEVLGFRVSSREQEGVALFVRYGLVGPLIYQQIDPLQNRWLIGGSVCLDAACTAAVPMFSTHWGAPAEEYPRQAVATVASLSALAQPHLFMGDLNVYRINQWNPMVRCTGPDREGGKVEALDIVERAGYVDAWKTTQTGPGWTGMASRPGCGEPNGNLYKRIDYVFAKGLEPLRTEQFGRTPPGSDSPSDHVGLIAEIAWPGQSGQ